MNPSDISIIAENFPGDQSINYASPVAGAYFSACVDDLGSLVYSNHTYKNLHKLQDLLGDGCGISNCLSTEVLDNSETASYFKSIGEVLDDFRVLSSDEVQKLSPESKSAVEYKAWIFNSPLLISKLLNYFTSLGVSTERKKLSSILDAYGKKTKAVFNCTGNGSKTLGGVEDSKVFPTRGQVVVINGPHIEDCYLRWGENFSTYIIKRPHSKTNEVILGGFYQPNNFDANTYGFETEDILRRTTELYPDLLLKNPFGKQLEDLQILRVVSGARPSREGGVRIEKEILEGGKVLIHNYGAGGAGYMCGLGMSYQAVNLLD